MPWECRAAEEEAKNGGYTILRINRRFSGWGVCGMSWRRHREEARRGVQGVAARVTVNPVSHSLLTAQSGNPLRLNVLYTEFPPLSLLPRWHQTLGGNCCVYEVQVEGWSYTLI